MAAALPSIATETARTADLTARESRLLPSTPIGDSFKTALAEARKPAKPAATTQPATDRASASPKKHSKTAKAKNGKTAAAQKKKAGTVEQDKAEQADATDPDAEPENADQQAPHDGEPSDQKKTADKADPTAVVKAAADPSALTPSQMVQQAAAALTQQPVATPVPKANGSTEIQAAQVPTQLIANKAKVVAKPPQQTDDASSAGPKAKAAEADADDAADQGSDPAEPAAATVVKNGGLTKTSHDQANEKAAGADGAQPAAADPSQVNPGNFSDLLASFSSFQSISDGLPATAPAAAASADKAAAVDGISAGLASTPASPTATGNATQTLRAANTSVAPQAAFNADNHANIVQSVQTQLLPNGGTMNIRLDPPELGVLQVSVHMKDGVMTASFQTSNDEATKLLSHSMGQLKQALESQGVTVGKMHVQQAPRNQNPDTKGNSGKQGDSTQQQQQDGSTRQEQQRKEALQRMWQRLALGSDPLDMVA